MSNMIAVREEELLPLLATCPDGKRCNYSFLRDCVPQKQKKSVKFFDLDRVEKNKKCLALPMEWFTESQISMLKGLTYENNVDKGTNSSCYLRTLKLHVWKLYDKYFCLPSQNYAPLLDRLMLQLQRCRYLHSKNCNALSEKTAKRSWNPHRATSPIQVAYQAIHQPKLIWHA